MYDPNKPPINRENPYFVFPKYKIETISGGLKVLMYQDKTNPLVSLRFTFKTGSEYDNIPGTTYLAFKMLTAGTKTNPGNNFSAEVEQLGGNISSFGSWDISGLGFTCLNENFEDMLELLRQSIFEPEFSDSEYQKLKKLQISNISQNLSDPSYLSAVALNTEIYQGHPYGNPMQGFIENIQPLELETVHEMYDFHLENSEKFIVVSGYFDEDEVLELLEDAFSGIRSLPGKNIFTDCLFPSGRNLLVTHRAGNQSNMKIAFPSEKKYHKDYAALQLLNTIYGGYFNSRLNKLLREEKGYTYGISSSIDSRRYSSVNVTRSSMKLEKTREALEDVITIINNLKNRPILKDEINVAVQYMLGSFTRTLEGTNYISSLIQTIEAYDLDPEFYNNLYKQLSMFTPTALEPIQRKYFTPENITVSICGDKEEILKQFDDWNNILITDFLS